MRKRRIGSLEVSVVGLGANNFGTAFFNECDQSQTTRVIHAALDAGVNLIDTAEEYSTKTKWGVGRSEEFVGVALGARRNDVVIATKFSTNVLDSDERGAKRIMSAVEGSLKRLGTDRIDLYQQHFPDTSIPIDEMLEALERLVKQGKVREIGCCNFSGAMIDDAQAASKRLGVSRFVSSQDQYNLLDRPAQEGTIEAVQRQGMMMLPYFPLASGLLTGKYKKGAPAPAGSRFEAHAPVADYLRDKQISDERIDKVEKLAAFARERGHTILELAFSWLASQPFVASVIAGAARPEQIQANAQAAGWELGKSDFDAVAKIINGTN